MRKLRCKLDGEKWCGRRGSLLDWYHRHLEKHGLEEPHRHPEESVDALLDRLTAWRNQYFEDSLYGEKEARDACNQADTGW